LVLSLIGLGVYGVFKSTEVILRKKKKEGNFYTISRHINIAASNFALTIFYCNLDDVILYFIIEFRSTQFDNGFRRFSSVLAIGLLILGGFFMCLHLMFVREYQKLKNAKQLLEVFKAKSENTKLIFKDFKDKTFFKQSFLFMILCRSLISSLIFATLFDYPVLQTTLLLILNISMVVLQLARNPFKETFNRWGEFFAEIVLVIAVSIMFVLSMLDYADSHPTNGIERLSKCIIVLDGILLLGCGGIMLSSLGKSFYEIYKKGQQLSKISALPDQSSAAQPINNMTSLADQSLAAQPADNMISLVDQSSAVQPADNTMSFADQSLAAQPAEKTSFADQSSAAQPGDNTMSFADQSSVVQPADNTM